MLNKKRMLSDLAKTANAQLINIENQRIQSDSIRRVIMMDLLYSYQSNNEVELSQINYLT